VNAERILNIQLTPAQIARALPRIAPGLQKYWWLQSELSLRDVATDVDYQRRFVGFYRVRRSAPWRQEFFRLLERGKYRPLTMRDALKHMSAATSRIEASFVSKLVATLNPGLPVIDSLVLQNLGLRLPTGAVEQRIIEIVLLHKRLADSYATFLDTAAGRDLIFHFAAAYPAFPITNTKMLDLVLWQTRPAKKNQ
jgi:hypothetical protein